MPNKLELGRSPLGAEDVKLRARFTSIRPINPMSETEIDNTELRFPVEVEVETPFEKKPKTVLAFLNRDEIRTGEKAVGNPKLFKK